MSSRIPTPVRPTRTPLNLALFGALFAMGGGALAHTGPSVQTMPELTVTASGETPAAYAGGQAARGGRLGLLGNSDFMAAPFNVSSVTAQAMQDQQAVTVADVLARDPSIRSTGQAGGIFDAFFIRGFAMGEGNLGELAFDGAYGVAPNFRVFTEYADRVEVVKGPAALLYGMSPNSGVGGVINIVPKRAQAKDLTRVLADYTSGGQKGLHADIGRRFGATKEFGLRFNAGRIQGDAPVDKQTRKANIGALSLDYQGEKLRATFDVLGQRENFDAPSRQFSLAPGVALPAAPNGHRNVTQRWEWSVVEDRGVLLRAEYDLNPDVMLYASAGGGDSKVARLFGAPQIFNAAGDIRVTPANFKIEAERRSVDAGVRARFHTGSVSHALNVQVSGYGDQLDRASINGTAMLSNIYAPRDNPAQNVATPAFAAKVSETDLRGLAVADTLSMLDSRLQLTLGARHQKIESDNFGPTGAKTSSYDRSAVTPLLAVVYQPWQRTSLYANYIQGLSKGDTAPLTASNAGEVFAPYKAKQYEVGVKMDHGKLATTLSLFQITKPGGQMNGNVYAADAEQRNRGVEFNVFGEALPGLRLMGGVTALDAKLTRTNSAATRGKDAPGTPGFQANLGAEWDLPATVLAGLTLTGNLSHAGKQYVDQANTQQAPGYTRTDLGLRYSARMGGKPVVLRASVQNAFNRKHWSGVSSYGGITQAAPRTVLLSAAVDF